MCWRTAVLSVNVIYMSLFSLFNLPFFCFFPFTFFMFVCSTFFRFLARWTHFPSFLLVGPLFSIILICLSKVRLPDVRYFHQIDFFLCLLVVSQANFSSSYSFRKFAQIRRLSMNEYEKTTSSCKSQSINIDNGIGIVEIKKTVIISQINRTTIMNFYFRQIVISWKDYQRFQRAEKMCFFIQKF